MCYGENGKQKDARLRDSEPKRAYNAVEYFRHDAHVIKGTKGLYCIGTQNPNVRIMRWNALDTKRTL